MTLFLSCNNNSSFDLFFTDNQHSISESDVAKNQIISMILNNAHNLGWKIKQNKKNKNKKNVFILTKNINNFSNNEKNNDDLIDTICDITKFN
jgi:hypothetical protein